MTATKTTRKTGRFDHLLKWPESAPHWPVFYRSNGRFQVDETHFFATLKAEFYYRRIWPTRARAIRGVADWIEDRYNRRRRHSSIGHVTPVDFEMQYSSQAAEIQLAA